MKISILYNKIAWFGKYSGYEYLINFLKPNNELTLFNASASTLLKKIKGKIYQYKFRNFDQTTFGLTSGCQFLYHAKADVKHILYLENHLYLLKIASTKALKKIIGTIHLPLSQWSAEKLAQLKNLSYGIILFEKEIESFRVYMPNAKIAFIRHGVDLDFFKPKPELINKNKIICIGHYLRDFECLQLVYRNLKAYFPELELHLIIPKQHRSTENLQKINQSEGVYWHEGLTDLELLRFYQSSVLMLMPMKNSGANTAIVQAISCGTPIVTTDCGGIRSYGGGDVFPVFEPIDYDGMTNYAISLIEEDSQRNKLQENLRNFAKNNLDWHLIAEKHQEFYQLINS